MDFSSGQIKPHFRNGRTRCCSDHVPRHYVNRLLTLDVHEVKMVYNLPKPYNSQKKEASSLNIAKCNCLSKAPRVSHVTTIILNQFNVAIDGYRYPGSFISMGRLSCASQVLATAILLLDISRPPSLGLSCY